MFSIYSLNKLTDAKEDSVNLPERTRYIQYNQQLILLLSIFSCFAAILLGFLVSFLSIFIILFPFIVGIFYSIQINPKLPRLKNITGVKNLMVALSWAVTVSLLPETYLYDISNMVSLIFYFIFVKFFINTVIFDIRDIEGDRKNNIKTIPVVIGQQKTKKMLLIIHSTLIPWIVVSIYCGFFTRYLPVLIFCIIYGYWYIHYFCNTEKIPKYATDLLVDGEWIFVAALCFIITLI